MFTIQRFMQPAALKGLIHRYRAALVDQVEQRERQRLDRLKAKYESVAR